MADKKPKKISVKIHDEAAEPKAPKKQIAIQETSETPEDLEKKIAEAAEQIPTEETENTEASPEPAPSVEVNDDQVEQVALPTAESGEDPIINTEESPAPSAPELPEETSTPNPTLPAPKPDIAPPRPVPTADIDASKSIGELADAAAAKDPETEFADPTISDAVDDIVAKETDDLLAAEDEARDKLMQTLPAHKPTRRGVRGALRAFWSNPAARWGMVFGFVLLLAVICVLPSTRYAILNTAGIRVKSSVTVIDKSSRQPLRNVAVTIQGVTVSTDKEGIANLEKLKLGPSDITIEKRGFAAVKYSKALGFGSNPLGTTELTATGSQFVFMVTDFLSKSPLSQAEAISGESSALADEAGKISLVTDQDSDEIEITIKADGYREEKLTFTARDSSERAVAMAPYNPHVFVSKRSGKFDVYKIDADGKNEQVLIPATGSERDDMVLLPHPTKNFAALVSTRENKKNKDGYLLSGLFVVDSITAKYTQVAESERIQLVDWQGDTIVFIQIAEGTSAANPKRSRLVAYNAATQESKELASANYFNDAYTVNNVVYYAPSSYALQANSARLYRIGIDGTGNTPLLEKEVWNLIRTDYDTLSIAAQDDWYELKISSGTTTKLQSPPNSTKTKVFENDGSKKSALWIDERDGKGVLLLKNTQSMEDKTLQTVGGMTVPLRWLNDTTVIYRLVSNSETADYLISTTGGDALKLVDVTNTGSAESFFYY